MLGKITRNTPGLLSALALFTCGQTQAQDWMVGSDVDMLIYSQPYWGGCTPGADYTFTLPVSPVTGVDYKVVVASLDPPEGSVSIIPGLDNGTVNSELIIDLETVRSVIFAAGTNGGTLEFRAEGVPTTAGQPHPCAASAFWMSNLMFCPEGLIPVINNTCTVQLPTGLNSLEAPAPTITWPGASNGGHLCIRLAGKSAVRILDMNGRTVLESAMEQRADYDLSALPQGLYLLNLTPATGKASSQRFVIAGS